MAGRRAIWIVPLFLIIGSCSRDTRPLDVRIKEALSDRLEQYDVKGASAAVILPDGSIHCVTAGVSHDTVTIKPEMLFSTGSITKNFVAVLILQLAENGLLSLEDPLHKWLPPYQHIDSNITIRQLLNHTSGIFMFWENQQLWDDLIKYRDSVFTPEVVLTYLKEPHFTRGNGFRYSNTNYVAGNDRNPCNTFIVICRIQEAILATPRPHEHVSFDGRSDTARATGACLGR
jgi:CubicO group peptidase (beta-lactamase class C family)